MSEPIFRRASKEDVPAIVSLLADDPLGATRETPDDLVPYFQAFTVIDADPHQFLMVVEGEGRVIGTLQITFIPGLSRKGATRALIEGVRVHRDARRGGLGTSMLKWAIAHARARGCAMVQLTADASRRDAHRFYARLGFERTHVGFKLML